MNDKSKLTNGFIDPYLLKYIRCNNDRDISVTGENNRLISRFNNIIGDENKNGLDYVQMAIQRLIGFGKKEETTLDQYHHRPLKSQDY